MPSRVIAVQHPGGDARQGQSEDHQSTEQLQHPPEVAREGASCRRLSRTEKRLATDETAKGTTHTDINYRCGGLCSYMTTSSDSDRFCRCHRGHGMCIGLSGSFTDPLGTGGRGKRAATAASGYQHSDRLERETSP